VNDHEAKKKVGKIGRGTKREQGKATTGMWKKPLEKEQPRTRAYNEREGEDAACFHKVAAEFWEGSGPGQSSKNGEKKALHPSAPRGSKASRMRRGTPKRTKKKTGKRKQKRMVGPERRRKKGGKKEQNRRKGDAQDIFTEAPLRKMIVGSANFNGGGWGN